MNIERIKQRLKGGGFKPFALRTWDGLEYQVHHPECLLIGGGSMAVLDHDGEVAHLDPLHVVALKNLPSPAKASAAR